ncbi:hypothetical protein NQ314_015135 [Rhamnusium bicolor]|uniref:Major facilitator superfamily (MFS) profile domain-containing protein n=1 Tax=Rhamnusium bicolor TaxID=1586634 RepID=A0AAV8WYT1_9CUCU|nr:hypothetical protein NQ314_015135 [Rhamnusium bicolor]
MTFNLILAIFPGIFLVLFYFLAQESPHYYNSSPKYDLTILALEINKENELIDLERDIKEERAETFSDVWKSKGLIKAFIISIVLMTFQQFSGINAVLFYSQSIFQEAHTTLEPAVCSIIIGCVQFGTSFVTPPLVDRLGRKILLVFSAIGMIISEVHLGVYTYLKDHDKDVSSISFVPIICLMLYIISFNSGFGPLPWTIMGELFPSKVKSIASSLTASFSWFLAFLITKYFKPVSESIGMGSSFFIFSACCVISIPFCILYVVETKGKSFQEIQTALNR